MLLLLGIVTERAIHRIIHISNAQTILKDFQNVYFIQY